VTAASAMSIPICWFYVSLFCFTAEQRFHNEVHAAQMFQQLSFDKNSSSLMLPCLSAHNKFIQVHKSSEKFRKVQKSSEKYNLCVLAEMPHTGG
jgi:hypothetical protein